MAMTVDLIDLHPLGPIQIREVDADGVYHRRVINPGAIVTGEPQAIQDACLGHWTPERLTAWADAQAAI